MNSWQVAVAYDTGLGILFVQLLQKLVERMFLQFGARVGGNAMFVKTAFVAYCYRTVVVAYGMNTTNTLRQGRDDTSIAAHVIVIRYLAEPFISGIGKSVDSQRLVTPVACAVNHEVFHILVVQGFEFFLHTLHDFAHAT